MKRESLNIANSLQTCEACLSEFIIEKCTVPYPGVD